MKLDKADTAFSIYIRTRDKWTCQNCGGRYAPGDRGIHCSHYFGRTRESTRFDQINCDALCFHCHEHFDKESPEDHREWKIKRIGEKEFKKLRMRADGYVKKDRKMAYLIAKKLLDNLK